jgi:hypothetical protein
MKSISDNELIVHHGVISHLVESAIFRTSGSLM